MPKLSQSRAMLVLAVACKLQRWPLERAWPSQKLLPLEARCAHWHKDISTPDASGTDEMREYSEVGAADGFAHAVRWEVNIAGGIFGLQI